MVMVPTPVGVQVRSQTDAPVNSLRPVAEIPADLPDLQSGQVFRARIQEVLPENTYKALVAGRSLTLALPESVKAGDTLELVVVARMRGTIAAKIVGQLAETGPKGMAELLQQSMLSPLGRQMAALLPQEGESAPAAMLTKGRSLMPLSSLSATELSQRLPAQLASAVSTSGLFYEAHQVQWALGKRPLASLLAEPQGQYAQPVTRAILGGAVEDGQRVEDSALVIRREAASQSASPLALLQKLFGRDLSGDNALVAEGRALANTSPNSAATVWSIPDDLRSLVQQQLEAAATQRLVWHGEVWPKQMIEWTIERDAPEAGAVAEDTTAWRTTLHLALPRLGEIDARVQLSGQNVQLKLQMSDAALSELRQAMPALQQALAAAGLTLQGVQSKQSGDG
ncbi:MAG: flagellar hook-length control protein FliK [Rugosibacter sp.]|nr:MAG: flagellar hook-length control protein FliK [Rugosibacter sp.]TBR09599.1 MAG: flagellar hook-length control protein FliK [Rugosibacter sp.]